MTTRLTDEFRELIELRWDEFIAREKNQEGTNFDAIVTALARACSKGDLRAIKMALDRMDGKIATEIEVEYPKFYVVYPYATKTADDEAIIEADELPAGVLIHNGVDEVTKIDLTAPISSEDEELPTGSLRAVLDKMLDTPKQTVTDILEAAKCLDNGLPAKGNPYVKSVIVAGLMSLVHKGQMGAVFEVFEQLDGKISEKYKMLGDDVYIQNFATIAPAGAVKNADGVYQIESDNITNAWAVRLEAQNGKPSNR